MALLTFKVYQVRKLIDHAIAATETTMSMVPCLFLNGITAEMAEVYADDEWAWISEPPWGIYLSSNGEPPLKDSDDDTEFVARPHEAATPEAARQECERLFDMMGCLVPLDLGAILFTL